MPTVVDILSSALKAIEKYGWIQGHYGNHTIGYCMVGAISTARYELRLIGHYPRQPYDAIRRAANFTGPVDKWNDAPERTKEDVIAAFRKAIEYERNTNT